MTFFDNLTEVQIAALAVMVALLLLFSFFKAGRFFGYVSTIVHEFGHAFMAKLTGEKVAGFKLNYDTSGETLVYLTGRRIPSMLIGLSGYPAPVILGVFGFLTVFYEMSYLFVGIMFIVGLSVAVLIRNFFSIIPVFIIWGFLFVSLIFGEVVVAVTVLGLSGVLVFYGLKDLYVLYVVNPPAGDAHALYEKTGLYSKAWIVVMFLYIFVVSTVMVLFSSQIFNSFSYIYSQIVDVFGRIAAIY